MTKRERAQVVELLKCAADKQNGAFAFVLTAYDLALVDGINPCTKAFSIAQHALVEIRRQPGMGRFGFRHRALEAAARVEEGSWP